MIKGVGGWGGRWKMPYQPHWTQIWFISAQLKTWGNHGIQIGEFSPIFKNKTEFSLYFFRLAASLEMLYNVSTFYSFLKQQRDPAGKKNQPKYNKDRQLFVANSYEW